VSAYDASNLTVDGSIKVVSALPTTPTNITFAVVGGNTLQISWPSGYTGWRLEGQTNSLNVGISATWFTVPGSTTTNQMYLPINPANPTAFYRLANP